ncbi:MAG: hypothetical protein ACQEQF_01780 [Bacillota bacterium]
MALNKSVFLNHQDTMLDTNKEFVNSLKSEKSDKKNVKQDKQEFLRKMGGVGTETEAREAKQKYKAALVDNTNYLVEAQMVFTDFFNRGTLGADQREWFYTLDEPITDNDARIYQITQHGNAPVQGIVQQGDTVFISPYWITTEEVSMSKFNLRMGDISNEEKMRERASKKVVSMTESDAKSLLENGLITDINTVDGIEIDEDVQDYPEATDIDITSESSGEITIDTMKAIVKHFMQLGKPVRNIYVPSSRMTDLWDWMSMPAGYDDGSDVSADQLVPQSVQEQIVRTGTVNSLFGYPVNLIPVNTMNGDTANGDVHIWVNTNEGAGEYRTFPEPVSSTYMHEDAQRIYYSIQRGTAMFQVPRQRMNYARFQIGTEV